MDNRPLVGFYLNVELACVHLAPPLRTNRRRDLISVTVQHFFFLELSYSIKLLITAKNLSLKVLVSLVFSEEPGSEQLHACNFLRHLRVTANQIIFHTFREKSLGLSTRLATSNDESQIDAPSLIFLRRDGGCTQAVWNTITNG